MGVLGRPQPVQLVMGVIFRDEAGLEEVVSRLESELGEIDARSEAFDFDVTHYYEDEMGPGLTRVFLSFKNLIDPGDIVDIKLTATRFEEEMGREGKRTVNLDPGYMDFNKLILVSAKFLAESATIGAAPHSGTDTEQSLLSAKTRRRHDRQTQSPIRRPKQPREGPRRLGDWR